MEIIMKIDAIVYTSNTGYTKEYALLLAKETGLTAYSFAEAKKSLARGSNIIYLGWVMASTVKEYPAAAKLYNVLAIAGVCLGTTGSQIEEIRKMQSIPESTPLFTLQGGFDMERLHGIYKFMMKMMRKFLKKQIGEKQAQTEEDKRIVDMLDNGGSAVCVENLSELLSWYHES